MVTMDTTSTQQQRQSPLMGCADEDKRAAKLHFCVAHNTMDVHVHVAVDYNIVMNLQDAFRLNCLLRLLHGEIAECPR